MTPREAYWDRQIRQMQREAREALNRCLYPESFPPVWPPRWLGW